MKVDLMLCLRACRCDFVRGQSDQLAETTDALVMVTAEGSRQDLLKTMVSVWTNFVRSCV